MMKKGIGYCPSNKPESFQVSKESENMKGRKETEQVQAKNLHEKQTDYTNN